MEHAFSKIGLPEVSLGQVAFQEIGVLNSALFEACFWKFQLSEIAHGEHALFETYLHQEGIAVGKVNSHDLTTNKIHLLKFGVCKIGKTQVAIGKFAIDKGAC